MVNEPAPPPRQLPGWLPMVVGVVAIAVGALWLLQGLDVLTDSRMSGSRVWAVIGPVVAVAGLASIILGNRARTRAKRAEAQGLELRADSPAADIPTTEQTFVRERPAQSSTPVFPAGPGSSGPAGPGAGQLSEFGHPDQTGVQRPVQSETPYHPGRTGAQERESGHPDQTGVQPPVRSETPYPPGQTGAQRSGYPGQTGAQRPGADAAPYQPDRTGAQPRVPGQPPAYPEQYGQAAAGPSAQAYAPTRSEPVTPPGWGTPVRDQAGQAARPFFPNTSGQSADWSEQMSTPGSPSHGQPLWDRPGQLPSTPGRQPRDTSAHDYPGQDFSRQNYAAQDFPEPDYPPQDH